MELNQRCFSVVNLLLKVLEKRCNNSKKNINIIKNNKKNNNKSK